MDVLDDEILSLWRALYTEGVRYIMIGGFATNLHGFARTTADIDLWVADSQENRIALIKALNSCGLKHIDALKHSPLIPGWTSVKLPSGFELDLMTYAAGLPAESFDACYEVASVAEIGGISIRFLHINDLIRSKEAANRPKDQIDLIELKRIREGGVRD